MATTTAETTSLIAFTLPSTPYSVQIARFYIRGALTYHDLGCYFGDAETVTSELVTNAVTHAGPQAVGLELSSQQDGGAIVIVVTDSCPSPPVKRPLSADGEHWRGLHLVEALSARWGWRPRRPGKAVYAILTRED